MKINIGCGQKYINGWINVDIENKVKTDKQYDVLNGIKEENDSVDYIYNEHFIEHLTCEEGLFFMKECLRVLKKDGVLRIATPNLKHLSEKYLDGCWTEFNWAKGACKTGAEMMNHSFYRWHHKYIYDYEELSRRLNESGFLKNNIYLCKHCDSKYVDLKNLEYRQESTLIVEAIK